MQRIHVRTGVLSRMTLSRRARYPIVLMMCCFVVGAVAVFGSFFTPDAWYDSLRKPSFNPPDWIFAPIWTLLYAMMAVAASLVASMPPSRERRIAIALMAIQLVLNGLWSLLFFGLHSPGIAFVDIAALWIAIVATIVAFNAVRPAAAILMVPYVLWVSFAVVLNGSIWALNA
jgi:translocator protein